MIGDIAHVCNRGFDKNVIFHDHADYQRFVESLHKFNNISGALRSEAKEYFASPPKQKKLVEILKWCLMPNHYHLLLYEVVDGGIVEFVKRLGNGYTKYFNIRNNRSGYLFQNAAKIQLIESDSQFLYIPFYIDLNPIDLHKPKWRNGSFKSANDAIKFLDRYKWSGYAKSKYENIINRDLFYNLFDTNPAEYKKEIIAWLKEPIPKIDPSTWQVDGSE